MKHGQISSSSQSRALRYVLSLRSVRPIAERLIDGKEVVVIDVGCGNWVYGDTLAIEIGKFNPARVRMVGLDPDCFGILGPSSRLSRTHMGKKTEFVTDRRYLTDTKRKGAEITVEMLHEMSFGNGYDLVLCFNPVHQYDQFETMLRLMRPGGLFIVSLDNMKCGLEQRDSSALTALEGIRILTNKRNMLYRVTDLGFDSHVFAATSKEKSEQNPAQATA